MSHRLINIHLTGHGSSVSGPDEAVTLDKCQVAVKNMAQLSQDNLYPHTQERSTNPVANQPGHIKMQKQKAMQNPPYHNWPAMRTAKENAGDQHQCIMTRKRMLIENQPFPRDTQASNPQGDNNIDCDDDDRRQCTAQNTNGV